MKLDTRAVVFFFISLCLLNILLYLYLSNKSCPTETNNTSTSDEASILQVNTTKTERKSVQDASTTHITTPPPPPIQTPSPPPTAVEPPVAPLKPEYYVVATVPDTLKMQHINAIRSWVVLEPPPRKIILFCNEQKVIDQIFELQSLTARRHLLAVVPSPKETDADANGKRYPFLDALFQGAVAYIKKTFNKPSTHVLSDYFIAYTNGDIILTQSFAKTMTALDKIREEKKMDIFGVGRRFNLELGTEQIPFTLDPKGVLEVDALIHKQRKEKGSLFQQSAQDIFVYSARTFSFKFQHLRNYAKPEEPYLNDEGVGVLNYVVASIAWDNWLLAYGLTRDYRIFTVDITTSAVAVHHNHGDLFGSHGNKWADHNRRLYSWSGTSHYDGYIVSIPWVLSKNYELVHRPVPKDPLPEEFPG